MKKLIEISTEIIVLGNKAEDQTKIPIQEWAKLLNLEI